MTVSTKTFGCRLNIVESEMIEQAATAAGLEKAVIVNTCAVTKEAVRQSRQAIRKAKRNNPDKKIIVTGCAAQIDPASFAQIDEVDFVLGNHEKLEAESYLKLDRKEGLISDPLTYLTDEERQQAINEKIHVQDIMEIKETAFHMLDGFGSHSKAFVQIQNGCDHRCTFCIIPFGRGPSRSVPMGFVVNQIKKLVDQGYREVILTGVDLTSYGSDLPGQPELGQLISSILNQCSDLPRLRLSSLDSIEIDDEVLDLIINEPRLMPHIHLSLQHGDNLILKRMKRRHTREQAIDLCQTLKSRRPEITFGADLIAGFPTETEAHFENSLALVDDCNLSFLHVFPFSPREGTPAARMPQLGKKQIQERASLLRNKGTRAKTNHFESQIGKNVRILMEQTGMGRAEDYSPIVLMDDTHQPLNSHIYDVLITSSNDTHLIGQLAS